MNNKTVLISDMHLSNETAKLNNMFKQCLYQWIGKIDALYILGDMFEYWIGDDYKDQMVDSFLQGLKKFSEQTPLFIMHGNRDFLLGKAFEEATGAKIINDPTLVNLYGSEYVLSHGDLLCTDDLAYQQFREQSRDPMWQKVMLSKPLNERKILAMQLRQMSEGVKQSNGKTAISDATETGVQQMMSAFSEGKEIIPTLIHGHTHRPAIHNHELEGKAFKRYVIQDWADNKGGYLVASDQGIEVKPLP